MNYRHELSKVVRGRIDGLIRVHKDEYSEAVGIKKYIKPCDRDTYMFLYNLNERVKTLFVWFQEGMNKVEGVR
jgi:hypothetical protein